MLLFGLFLSAELAQFLSEQVDQNSLWVSTSTLKLVTTNSLLGWGLRWDLRVRKFLKEGIFHNYLIICSNMSLEMFINPYLFKIYRFSGTIVGVGDKNSSSGWADSEWRSLKVTIYFFTKLLVVFSITMDLNSSHFIAIKIDLIFHFVPSFLHSIPTDLLVLKFYERRVWMAFFLCDKCLSLYLGATCWWSV